MRLLLQHKSISIELFKDSIEHKCLLARESHYSCLRRQLKLSLLLPTLYILIDVYARVSTFWGQ